MYSIIIKGRDIPELKDKFLDFAQELFGKQIEEEKELSDLGVDPFVKFAGSIPKDADVIADSMNQTEEVTDHSEEERQSVPSGEVDVNGMPWDKRIHASSKSINKDGSWRYQRGVDKETIVKIEAQLRASKPTQPQAVFTPPSIPMNGSAGNVVPFVPPPTPFGSGVPSSPIVQQQFAPPAVSPPTLPDFASNAPIAPLSPTAAPQFVSPTPISQPIPVAPQVTQKPAHDFASFKASAAMTIAGLVQAGAIGQDYLQNIRNHFGGIELWEIFKDDTKCQALFGGLVQANLITQIG